MPASILSSRLTTPRRGDAYLLTVSRYIHRNPIDCTTPLAARIRDWRWSSYPDQIAARSPAPWPSTSEILRAMGLGNAAERYRRFVDALTARRGRPPGSTRPFAMWLCRQESGASLGEIGRLHHSAVTQAIRRLRDDLGADTLERWREAVMTRLDHEPG